MGLANFQTPLRVALLALVAAMLAAQSTAADNGDASTREERSHWSLQPRSQPNVPTFSEPHDTAWVSNSVDAFILARLKQAELRPSSPADRRTLVRRLSFNLLGLPPTP